MNDQESNPLFTLIAGLLLVHFGQQLIAQASRRLGW